MASVAVTFSSGESWGPGAFLIFPTARSTDLGRGEGVRGSGPGTRGPRPCISIQMDLAIHCVRNG
jgi:hypothetical protein